MLCRISIWLAECFDNTRRLRTGNLDETEQFRESAKAAASFILLRILFFRFFASFSRLL
jgi:hypothetical protein